MNLLTSSRLKLWQQCPRAHWYRYEVGLTANAPDAPALLFGTAAHHGLEAWWLAHKEDAPQYALAASLEAAERSYPADDPFASAMLRALLCGYDARWSEWARTVEVIGVELPFECALTHPVSGTVAQTWRVAGKMDGLLRLSDGRVAILEHKSRSGDASAGSDYRRALTLDAQVSAYFLGAAALGYDADLCIYDVLRKPALDPYQATPMESRKYTEAKSRACKECSRKGSAKNPATPPPHMEGDLACVDGRIITDVGGKLYASMREADETALEYEARLIGAIAETPDKYMIHAEIVRSDQEREAHAWALWHAIRSIEETRKAARVSGDVRAVPQHAGACMSHGSMCAYLPICEGTASARDPSRYRRLPTVHPELATETADAAE